MEDLKPHSVSGEPVGAKPIGVGALAERYAEMAARYQQSIDNQKAIITSQGYRIMEALSILGEIKVGTKGPDPLLLKAIAVLKGQDDG